MFTDRPTRFDDKLFIALLFVPAVFAGARYLESRSEMDRIALQSKPVMQVATVPAPATQVAAGTTNAIRRF